jgi:hypothetical protein
MPYIIKGKCIYKKDTGKKVGCTKSDSKKYLRALHTNVPDGHKVKKLKEVIRSMIKEMISSETPDPISNKEEKEVENFELYIKTHPNMTGQYISFTVNELKDILTLSVLPKPFSKNQFEIRYKSVEDFMDDKKLVKANKTTVIKKFYVGQSAMYKAFILSKPTENDEEDSQELKEAAPPTPAPVAGAPAPVAGAPAPVAGAPAPVAGAPADSGKEAEEPPKEKKKEKLMEITSSSFTDLKGDPTLLVNFLKSINEDEDIGGL